MSNSKNKPDKLAATDRQPQDRISCFSRKNYIVMILSACLIGVGFCLMSGPSCTMEYFNPEVFRMQRIAIAPTISFFGYLLMIVGILV